MSEDTTRALTHTERVQTRLSIVENLTAAALYCSSYTDAAALLEKTHMKHEAHVLRVVGPLRDERNFLLMRLEQIAKESK